MSQAQIINPTGDENLTKLFPTIQPYHSELLKVSDIHTIYYEQCGNPEGKSVIFVHGGPGGGCTDAYRQFHDPQFYRIILFDQRGCGRSTPFADLRENTTQDCIDDIERIREKLNIDKWQVFGGSWGSTLGLAYAQAYPDKCTELVLRGIFMLRKCELDFFYQEGSSFIYPEMWEPYRDHIPVEERHDYITAYHKRLVSDDEDVRLKAAIAWTTWEKATSKLLVSKQDIESAEDPKFALAFARIENHYFYNTLQRTKGFFQSDEQLLDNVDKIRKIPTVIVQGRYDMVCPIKSAYELAKKFPEAEFKIIQDAGHSCMEKGILSELVRATIKFAKK